MEMGKPRRTDEPQDVVSGLGVPCPEAQADGVPCLELRPSCDGCDRAPPVPSEGEEERDTV